MALINCPDCNQQVSTNAVSCPKCGAPVAKAREFEAAGSPLTTTQETSKKLKLHTVFSSVLVIIGFMVLVLSAGVNKSNGGEPSVIPPIMVGVGVVWFIVTKVKIWWHHK